MKQPYGTFDAFLAIGMLGLVFLLAVFCVVGLTAAAWWVIR